MGVCPWHSDAADSMYVHAGRALSLKVCILHLRVEGARSATDARYHFHTERTYPEPDGSYDDILIVCLTPAAYCCKRTEPLAGHSSPGLPGGPYPLQPSQCKKSRIEGGWAMCSLSGSRTPLSRDQYMTGACTNRYTNRDSQKYKFDVHIAKLNHYPEHSSLAITAIITSFFI